MSTQPPYRIDGPRPAGSWSILNQNGNLWIEGPRIGGNGVFPTEGIISLNDGCCTEADAKLIAAAPDLAEALRKIADQSAQDHEDPEQEAYDSRQIAAAALAKAGL